MAAHDRAVDLGFAQARVPRGSHLCQVFHDDDERNDALLRFASRGLEEDEATACFTEKVSAQALAAWFAAEGLSLEGEEASGRFALSAPRQVYFEDGRFDPDRMLERLTCFYEASVASGRAGARVIGEMSPEISTTPGGSRLMEYESRINQLLQAVPLTAVCQYDAHAFSGATIMDVLSVHPMVLVRGAVIFNPLYRSPEDFARR